MYMAGAKGDWEFRISDQVKNPDGTDIYPCCEFRWSPEGPVSQIHSPHLHTGPLEIFSDLFKVCSDAEERMECGKQREATAPIYP